MIKFFRNIRQKLIDKGNLRKYLIYAAGEIILVVIGILIALQINNFNMKNIEKDTIEKYWVQLRTELTSLIEHEEKQLKNSKLLISQIKRCQQLVNQHDPDKISEFKSCLPYLHTTWLDRPQYPIFEEFMEGGWMSKIEDPSIKKLLIDVRQKLLIIEEIDGVINKKYEELVSPFFSKKINRSEIPSKLENPDNHYVDLVEGGPPTNFQALYDDLELWGMLNEKHKVTAFMEIQQKNLIKLLKEVTAKFE